MKKSAIVITALLLIALFSGCGQEINVTVYNSSGVFDKLSQAITVSAVWDSGTITRHTAESATSVDNLNENNSFSVVAKENDTFIVRATGNKYTYYSDPVGVTKTLEPFDYSSEAVTLYGGMPNAPEWYAAVYADSILIYKK